MSALGITVAASVLVLSLIAGGLPVHPAASVSIPLTLLSLAAGLLFAVGPGSERLRRSVNRSLMASPRWVFNSLIFALSALLSAVVSLLLFNAVPYLDDGVASLFQARIFTLGALTHPLPRLAEFFELFGILGAEARLGHWASMYPPGWPLLLVPGLLLKLPWLVNPLLGGALSVATAELARELYDERAGRIAGLMAMASPFLLILAATHLSHTSAALFGSVCLWSTMRLLRTGHGLYGAVAGLSWGAAFLCRPLDALLLGTLFALVPLLHWRRSLAAWRGIALALCLAVMAALLLASYQKAVTGDPLTPGHSIGMGNLGSFGFIHKWGSRYHTPSLAVDFTLRRLRAINDSFSGWPLPFFLFALTPIWAKGVRLREMLLLACPLVLAGVFAFYWYYEDYFPGRYLASGSPMLFVLAGRGIVLLDGMAAGRGSGATRLLTAVLAASVFYAGLVALPSEFRTIRRNIGDVEHTLPQVVETYGITDAVVFMDAVGSGVNDIVRGNDFYATGFLRNGLDLDDDVMFARNLRDMNHLLINAYPGRSYYLYRYHRDTHRALLYRLIPLGKAFCLYPVPPRETELLIIEDTVPVTNQAACDEKREEGIFPPHRRSLP